MASFIVYDSASGKALWVAQQPEGSVPAPGAGLAYISCADGTTLGRGDRVADGALVKYIATLSDNKAAKSAAATAVCVNKINAGYNHGDGHVFQLGPDRLGSTGAFNLAAIGERAQQAIDGDASAWPTGSYIRDAANVNVTYGAADARAVAVKAGVYVSALRRHYCAIKDAIAAAQDQAALDAIDVTAGYPPAPT